MTRDEWAALLPSLHGDNSALSDALLMMSDEDWIAEEDRCWLRAAAMRDAPLRPCSEIVWTYASYDWTSAGNKIALIPTRVARQLCQEEANSRDYTVPYAKHEEAWADLLQAITRK